MLLHSTRLARAAAGAAAIVVVAVDSAGGSTRAGDCIRCT